MAYARIREFKAPGVPLKEQWLDLASRAYDQVTIIGALVLMVAALTLDLMVAPNEVSQGVVQRIFYVHVPSAWIAFLAFFLVLVCSVRYLMTRARRWDIYAHACAEVGIVFCTLVLITGPIWAKPIWGVWWTWDARLTLTLILWFVYLAYLMIRAQDLEPDKKARYAAVLGIVGALSIPINHFSVLLWRTLHPKPVVIAEEGFGKGLAHPMFLIALGVTLLAFLALFAALVRQRVILEEMRDQAARLRSRLDERGVE